jgi:hypothetical protein
VFLNDVKKSKKEKEKPVAQKLTNEGLWVNLVS